MKRVYCDHCGQLIKDRHTEATITLGDAHIEKHDLCRKCTEDFIEWLGDYFETKDQRRIK